MGLVRHPIHDLSDGILLRMAPGSRPGDGGSPDVEAELRAERAAAAHWRQLAEQRSEEYRELRHRPFVRAGLALDARLGSLLARLRSSGARARRIGHRVALTGSGLSRRRVGTTHDEGAPDPPPELRRGTLVVVIGAAASPEPLGSWFTDDPSVEVVAVTAPVDVPAGVDAAIARTDPDLVALMADRIEPVSPSWLAVLGARVTGHVVAATPLVVHPWRPWAQATAHDGLVRSAGFDLTPGARGEPMPVPLAAGTTACSARAPHAVAAGSAAGLLIDRRAYEAVGGLAPIDDVDVAVVELCARLRAQGGTIEVVPEAVVVDHRPIRARSELVRPIDPFGAPWRQALDRSGSLLGRTADRRADPPLRLAITTAAPSAKVASRWGDWHLAHGMAEGLRRQGVEVRVQTADGVDDPASRASDVHLVLRGLRSVRRTSGQRHVLWIISHPESLDDDELDAADVVLVASERFANHLRRRTATPVEVLLQATDHRRFRPVPPDPSHRHDIAVVAKTRDVSRQIVADAVAAGLRPAIYGGGWRGLVDPDLIITDHIDNELLPTVYASAGVVLNDHWPTMQAWGFMSNRIFDVLACGTPVISDPVSGIREVFARTVDEYEDPEHLRALVDRALSDPAAARRRAAEGRDLVLASHTFDHRAAQLLEALARYAKDGGIQAR
jgi:hypothetical protein